MLYEAHFGLTDLPFRNTPDPRYVCWLPQYEQALAMVEYAIEEREMVLLTGDIGVGKTTVIRAALQQVEAAAARVVVLVYPRMTPYQLLAQLATALEVPPARSRYVLMNQLAERLVDLWQEGCRVALVLDEAHLLPSKAVFDEIRFLSNLQLDTANLLGIVLVGQPEVETSLCPGPARDRRRPGPFRSFCPCAIIHDARRSAGSDAGYRMHTRCVGFSKREPGIPPGIGCQVPGTRCRIPTTWHLVPDTRYRINAEGRIPSTEDRAGRPGTGKRAHEICRIGRARILATRYPEPGTWHPCPIPTFCMIPHE